MAVRTILAPLMVLVLVSGAAAQTMATTTAFTFSRNPLPSRSSADRRPLLSVVFGVGDRVEPPGLAAEANVDLNQFLSRHGAVPVDDFRAGIVALAFAELLDRAAFFLRAHAAILDQQQLAVVVAMPVGPGAGFEAAPRRAQILAVHHRRLAGELRRVLLCVGGCDEQQAEARE